jgi:hypothetical protein
MKFRKAAMLSMAGGAAPYSWWTGRVDPRRRLVYGFPTIRPMQSPIGVRSLDAGLMFSQSLQALECRRSCHDISARFGGLGARRSVDAMVPPPRHSSPW